MWVYSKSSNAASSSAWEQQTAAPPMRNRPFPAHFSEERGAATTQSQDRPAGTTASAAIGGTKLVRSAGQASTHPLALYAGLYGAGLFLAGGILALSCHKTRYFISYYTQNWLSDFESASPLHIFSTLFLTGVLSLTVLLILGLSACGIPFIYAFLLGKGIGSGLLAIELFQTNGAKGLVKYLLLPGLSDAFLACCLCSLGEYAIRTSGLLFRCSMLHPQAEEKAFTAKLLFSQYLFLATLLILSSGSAAVVAGYLVPLLR